MSFLLSFCFFHYSSVAISVSLLHTNSDMTLFEAITLFVLAARLLELLFIVMCII